MQVSVVKFAEFYEKELFKYPKQRVWALERQLDNEKKRRHETQQEISQLKKLLRDATDLNQEVT